MQTNAFHGVFGVDLTELGSYAAHRNRVMLPVGRRPRPASQLIKHIQGEGTWPRPVGIFLQTNERQEIVTRTEAGPTASLFFFFYFPFFRGVVGRSGEEEGTRF